MKVTRKAILGALISVPLVIFAQAPPPQPSAAQSSPDPIVGQPGHPPRPYNQNREGYGAGIFGDYCLLCHGNAEVERAPSPSTLKQMSPEKIYTALTTGSMKEMARDLNDDQKRGVAEWVSGRRLGASGNGDIKSMTNACGSKTPVRTSTVDWNGWSPDSSNTRFQPPKSAGLTAAQLPGLKLKWAFGLPGAMSMYAQPAIAGDRIFVGSDGGYMYSVDVASGCVYWSFQAQSGIRSAATVGPVKPGSSKIAAFFGDVRGNAYAVDASNGELLWKVATDPNPVARIIGAPQLFEGRLYVPVTGLDEVESNSPNFACCSSRGIIVALNAETGKQIWKTYTIAETPKVIKKMSNGRDVMGPSGAGVWNTPTLDRKRRAIYFGTGNGFTGPPVKTTDSIMALSIDTGKVLWSFQGTEADIWHVGCPQGIPGAPPNAGRGGRGGRGPAGPPREDCVPVAPSPDWDFSASPILVNRPGGRSMLIAGQKSGVVWALDPDKKGALIWKYEPPESRGRVSIVFGGAADDQNAYFNSRPGIYAVGLSDGVEKWFTPLPPPIGLMQDHPGASAAVSSITGVVFSVGLDGLVRALSAGDGKIVWEFNTAQEFKTVNGVAGKGGSIGSGGVAISKGMIFVASGYVGFQNGAPGNVLLAFGPQ